MGYQYLLLLVFAISLATLQTAFAQQSPEDCGPDQVYVPGQCVDIDEGPQSTTFTIETDQSSYVDGEIIRIFGFISELDDNFSQPLTLIIIDPFGNMISVAQIIPYYSGTFSTFFEDSSERTLKTSGVYKIRAEYGAQKTSTTFSFSAEEFTPTPTHFDTVPPSVLVPSDMTVDAFDSSGARVHFSVKAIDDEDDVLTPRCSPSSGSLFSIGDTTVTCSATDHSGNSDRKSFIITVITSDIVIPSWIRDVAGFWCGDEIDEGSFIGAVQYLINNDVIIVPTAASSGSSPQQIPNWIKSNACWWSQDLISNNDFALGLQYLLSQGIIVIPYSDEVETEEPEEEGKDITIELKESVSIESQ